MLHRATGAILFVQPPGGSWMLTPLRPTLRDRRRHEQEPKPDHVGAAPRRASPPPPLAPAWSSRVERIGRWRRVSSWWLFAAEELESILSRPWRALEVE